MEKLKSILIVFIIISISFLILYNPNQQTTPQACINDQCFNLEIVKTSAERTRGLMHRSSLPQDQGMLFIFPEQAKHSFWMKNTLIPLDIIWINNDKIVHIENSVLPCQSDPCQSYVPNENALYVLEINSGLAQRNGFQKNDNVKLNYIN
jgi:uncharacterized protein